MRKLLELMVCVLVVGGGALVGGAVGSWWPVRDVAREDIWAGDGIGILLFGTLGLLVGGMVGALGLGLVLALTGRRTGGKHPARPRSAWSMPDE